MKYFYLDNNIIIDLKNNRNEHVDFLINNLDQNNNKIVFSPAHIEEIAATVKHYNQPLESANEKLEFLKNLTQSYCLLPFPRDNLTSIRNNGINTYQEDPVSAFSRVYNLYHRNYIAENHQRQKLERGEFIEKNENISSLSMNNADMDEALNLYKKELFRVVTVHYKMLKKDPVIKEYLPRKPLTIGMLRFVNLKSYFPMFEMVVEKLMEHLEYKRYYPDKSDKNIASLHDTTHAIYGAYADVFVTNDRGLAYKVKAVYKWLGVDTIVLTRKEFIEQFSQSKEIA